jgi:hypothetical protein
MTAWEAGGVIVRKIPTNDKAKTDLINLRKVTPPARAEY